MLAYAQEVELSGRVVSCVVSDVGKATDSPDPRLYVTIVVDDAPAAWRGRLPAELQLVGVGRVVAVGAKVVVTTELDDKRPPTPVTTLPLLAIRLRR